MKHLLALIPQVGTSLGALLGTQRFWMKHQNNMRAIALGILFSVCIDLGVECLESAASRNSRMDIVVGVALGWIFVRIVLYWADRQEESVNGSDAMFLWAMVLHNVPEGIVTGIGLCGETMDMAIMLSIAIQNIPDGLVVAMPLLERQGRAKAWLWATLSGVVEPAMALGILFFAEKGGAEIVQKLEPVLNGMSFAVIFLLALELYKESQEKRTWVMLTSLTLAIMFKML